MRKSWHSTASPALSNLAALGHSRHDRNVGRHGHGNLKNIDASIERGGTVIGTSSALAG